MAYLLAEDSKDAYDGQVNPSTSRLPLQATLPYLVHALLARLLTDDMLNVAHHAVIHAEQRATKYESLFVQRMLSASRECRKVFQPAEFIHAVIRSLP